MDGGERIGPMAGPFSNLSQTYVAGLDATARRLEPLAVGAARCNLALFSLATRRAQAWLEIPIRLGQCGAPNDLVSEQVRFWQTAVQDYTDGTRRLALAFVALTLPGFDGRQAGNAAAATRDYLAFSEPARTGRDTAKRDRRAA